MIFSYYYLDMLLLVRDFFLVSVVLVALCLYTFLEKKLSTVNYKVGLFYSVALYFLFVLNIYLVSAFSQIQTYYYLFNYSLSNVYGVFFFKIILIVFFLLIFFASISEKYFNRIKYIPFEANFILMFVFIGMIYLLYSFDFLMIFLNLELQNFSLYILMNIQRNKKIVVETCIKYYVIGGVSSAFVLYGISLIYGFTGKVNLFDLILFFSEINTTHFGILLGLCFFFCGLFIKLGLAPFHFWVPQIYEGAPNFVTLVLLVLPKFVLFVLFIKLYLFVFKFVHQILFQVICINVVLSLIFGSFGALWQNNIKKFMAYSAITNSGFILLALSLFSFESLFAGVFYLLVYLLSTFSIFYAFIIVKPKQLNSYALLEFKNFTCLKLINPLLLIMLSINFLSLAGIPPLSGFISKFLILISLVETNNLKLLLFLILISLIAAYYYIRTIKILVFTNEKQPKFLSEIPYFSGVILVVTFYFNFLVMLQPSFFFLIIENILTPNFFFFL